MDNVTIVAFTDELEKIATELEKEAFLGRIPQAAKALGRIATGGLSPAQLAQAQMGTREIAALTGTKGLGALRGAGRAGQATQKVVAPIGETARLGLAKPMRLPAL